MLRRDVEVLEELAVLEHQREPALVGRDAGEVAAVVRDRCRRRVARGRRPRAAAWTSRSRTARAPRPPSRPARRGRRGRRRPSSPKRTVRSRHRRARVELAIRTLPSSRRAAAAPRASPPVVVGGEHDGRRHRHPEVLRAGVADQPVDHHRQRRVGRRGPGSWSRRTHRARPRRRTRPRRAAPARPTGRSTVEQHPQRAGAQRRRRLALPVVDGAEHRARPCGRRAAARPSPGRSGSAATSVRRSSGGWSRVIRKPKPTVTAETPSGSMNTPSRTAVAPAARGARDQEGHRSTRARGRARWPPGRSPGSCASPSVAGTSSALRVPVVARSR